MDKIFSARLDESVIRRIGALANQLGATKKAIIENAIRFYAEQIEQEHNTDLLEITCGAWRREKSSEETVADAKREFRDSMKRQPQ